MYMPFVYSSQRVTETSNMYVMIQASTELTSPKFNRKKSYQKNISMSSIPDCGNRAAICHSIVQHRNRLPICNCAATRCQHKTNLSIKVRASTPAHAVRSPTLMPA